jgi:hypothetical protein
MIDPIFLKRLNESRPATFRVAEWIHRGDARTPSRTVIIPAIRPELGPDKGDIWVEDLDGFTKIVEVKHRAKLPFTCVDDYPFPTIIVSNVGSVKRNWGHVLAYVVVNSTMTYAAVLGWDNHKHWFEEDIFASNSNKMERFFMCPKEHATFVRLVE